MAHQSGGAQPTPAAHTYRPLLLRRLRLRAGYSLETVALRAGLHDKAQISRFERGIAIPLVTTLGKLLHALQPVPEDLYLLFNLPPNQR